MKKKEEIHHISVTITCRKEGMTWEEDLSIYRQNPVRCPYCHDNLLLLPARKRDVVSNPFERPAGSSADEWSLFLEEYHDSRPFLAVQIAEAIEEAVARERSRCLNIVSLSPFKEAAAHIKDGTIIGIGIGS